MIVWELVFLLRDLRLCEGYKDVKVLYRGETLAGFVLVKQCHGATAECCGVIEECLVL